jgi:hypothetical protein
LKLSRNECHLDISSALNECKYLQKQIEKTMQDYDKFDPEREKIE